MFLEDAVAKVSESGWESFGKYKEKLAGYSDYPSLDLSVQHGEYTGGAFLRWRNQAEE